MDVKSTLKIIIDEIVAGETKEKSLIRKREMAEKLAVVLGDDHPLWEQLAKQIKEADPEMTLEIEDIRQQRVDLVIRGQELSRKLENEAVNYRGWVSKSRAGKRVRDWDTNILRALYPNLEISGKPLIEVREEVNADVFDQAVKIGAVDVERVIALGGYKEGQHKRAALFYNEIQREAERREANND